MSPTSERFRELALLHRMYGSDGIANAYDAQAQVVEQSEREKAAAEKHLRYLQSILADRVIRTLIQRRGVPASFRPAPKAMNQPVWHKPREIQPPYVGLSEAIAARYHI